MRVHRTDKEYLIFIREHIRLLIRNAAARYDAAGLDVLEIGPGEYDGAREYFKQATVKTMDNNPKTEPDYLFDICSTIVPNLIGALNADVVVCTDVLEHVINPFRAINHMRHMLKGGGVLILSVPLNFRIHGMGDYKDEDGPAPDYWRFTESGIRLLLENHFDILDFQVLESDRDLFPIHYNVIAKKR